MKFLCVKCDEPMKLMSSVPPDRGSLTVVYRCPGCSHEIAMLTNPFETQVVSSLGVKIGPAGDGEATASAEGDLSKCPFSEVAREMTGVKTAPSGGVAWTPEATRRLDNIPEFVRPMARTGIEKFARDNGYERIDEEVLDRAKDFFGM
jgi:hypothetical protein